MNGPRAMRPRGYYSHRGYQTCHFNDSNKCIVRGLAMFAPIVDMHRTTVISPDCQSVCPAV